MSAFRVRFLASGLALSLFVIGCGRDVSKKQKDPGPTSNNSSCGDGLLAPSEKCDPAIGAGDVGACPTSCAGPTGGCATSTLVGDAESCTAQCVTVDAACAGGDGCCAPQCDATSDSDCTNTCGDGVVEGSEACDGNCPRGCDDGDACTVDGSTGSAATCSLVCTHAPVTACSGGVSYEVVCYPGATFEYKIPLDTFKKIGKTLEKTLKTLHTYYRGSSFGSDGNGSGACAGRAASKKRAPSSPTAGKDQAATSR